MAWVDTNGPRIAKSEKIRLKSSYKSKEYFGELEILDQNKNS